MQRSACFLAIFGLAVQTACGGDLFGPGTASPRPQGRSLFYSGIAQGTEGEKVPERFRRSTEEPALQELRNDSSELPEALPSAGLLPSRSRLKPAPAEPATPAEFPSRDGNVIHAEYERDSQTSDRRVQPVRGEGAVSRPFPRARGGAETGERSPVQPRNSLTTPIPLGSQSKARAQQAPTPPRESLKGRLTVRDPSVHAAKATASPQVQKPLGEAEAGAQTPSVSIEWVKKSDIHVGQPCRCDLVVKNTGESSAHAVEVDAHFPANVRLVKADPEPARSESFLGWEFEELQPGEERTIQVTLVPLQRGSIATRADVRFTGTAHGQFEVSEPLLAVEIEGPSEVLVGEPASHTVVVTNPGSGIATNVQVEAVIPEGLEHARGERLMMQIGSLNPGESRSVRLALGAAKGGRHQLQVKATADSGLVRRSTSEVKVIASQLAAAIEGPRLRYLGRQGLFTLTVVNDGAAPTDNVRVMHKIPQGFEFVSSDRGAQYDPATRILNWFVGRLDQDQQVEMKVTLAAAEIGEFEHLVRATSEQGSLSDASLETSVEGASSLSVEIIDLDDPVEVGTEMIYEIHVRNDGSAPARQIGLICELAPGMSCVKASGPAAHATEEETVSFRTIPELGPGEKLLFRVHVASSTAGTLRFRTRLSSESIAEPLTTEELTKFYGD